MHQPPPPWGRLTTHTATNRESQAGRGETGALCSAGGNVNGAVAGKQRGGAWKNYAVSPQGRHSLSGHAPQGIASRLSKGYRCPGSTAARSLQARGGGHRGVHPQSRPCCSPRQEGEADACHGRDLENLVLSSGM